MEHPGRDGQDSFGRILEVRGRPSGLEALTPEPQSCTNSFEAVDTSVSGIRIAWLTLTALTFPSATRRAFSRSVRDCWGDGIRP